MTHVRVREPDPSKLAPDLLLDFRKRYLVTIAPFGQTVASYICSLRSSAAPIRKLLKLPLLSRSVTSKTCFGNFSSKCSRTSSTDDDLAHLPEISKFLIRYNLICYSLYRFLEQSFFVSCT